MMESSTRRSTRTKHGEKDSASDANARNNAAGSRLDQKKRLYSLRAIKVIVVRKKSSSGRSNSSRHGGSKQRDVASVCR